MSLSLLLLSAPALAWDRQGATWPAEAFPIPYWVTDSFGPDLDDAEALAATQAAFDTWAAVECAGVTFAYQGRVGDATFGEADGRNVVFFYTDAWPGEASLVSAPAFTQDGTTMVDVDIALNGRDYAWATTGADGRARMDLQASVTHEVGHLLGLWHSTVEGATLNPSMDGNPDATTLEDDDVTGLCTLYSPSVGTGAQGEACEVTEDCADGLVCLADGEDRYCTATCPDGTCPDGYECLDAGGEPTCALALEESGCGCTSGGGGVGAVGVLAGLVFALRRR